MKEIFDPIDMTDVLRFGAIAQLVEHLHGMQGVRSSNLLGSTRFSLSGSTQVEQKLEQTSSSDLFLL